MSITRINTNVQAQQAFNTMQSTNDELALRQRRLSTGLKINSAEDDSAGFAIAKKLEARTRGQAQALSNIGDAKGMLTVAEGSLNSTMDILQTMKEKTVQAANDSMGQSERDAIQSQLTELTSEISETLGNTDFNGKNLFTAGTAGTSLTFQVGAEGDDTFTAEIDGISVSGATTGLGSVNTTTGDINDIDVTGTATLRQDAIDSVNAAIGEVADQLASIGDDQTRLSFKQDNLSTAKTNYEASQSRIEDADFAQEQVEISKLQILQQTGNASLSQANAASQSVLQLLG